jgi:predicted PurR-regulated permease PerM
MIYLIIIVFLLSIIIAAAVSITNLIKYSERMEDYLETYETKLIEVREKIIEAEIRLKEIDIRGSFEADDEVGFIFNSIKEISSDLTKTIETLYTDERN